VLTFVRSRELRGARWDEFDLDRAEWRIPAARMKITAEHIVPLSRQAIACQARNFNLRFFGLSAGELSSLGRKIEVAVLTLVAGSDPTNPADVSHAVRI